MKLNKNVWTEYCTSCERGVITCFECAKKNWKCKEEAINNTKYCCGCGKVIKE